jgi:hypothetical protein
MWQAGMKSFQGRMSAPKTEGPFGGFANPPYDLIKFS